MTIQGFEGFTTRLRNALSQLNRRKLHTATALKNVYLVRTQSWMRSSARSLALSQIETGIRRGEYDGAGKLTIQTNPGASLPTPVAREPQDEPSYDCSAPEAMHTSLPAQKSDSTDQRREEPERLDEVLATKDFKLGQSSKATEAVQQSPAQYVNPQQSLPSRL